MPWFICPNCKQRSVDIDGVEGFSEQAPQCRHCGFGFLFELMDDYYPAPSAGFVVCDAEGRILAVGRGVFELTGYQEKDLLGKDVMEAFSLSGWDDIQGCQDNPAINMGCCGCNSWQVTAKSKHPGGVMTGFGDGHVQFIANSISQRAWFLLHSRNDGQAIGEEY